MKGRAIIYQPEELAWIEARKEMPRTEAHALFCAYWKRDDVSIGAYNGLCKRKGWTTGRTGCFSAGQAPRNKGKPMSAETRAKVVGTMFKKGQLPHNTRGHGHERIDSRDGYVVMIVEEMNPWTGAATRPVHKHRYLWEHVNGPIPEGYALKCLDGDKTNTDPSNWEAVPRGVLVRLNGGRHKKRLAFDEAPAELKPTVMATAKLLHRARELKSPAT